MQISLDCQSIFSTMASNQSCKYSSEKMHDCICECVCVCVVFSWSSMVEHASPLKPSVIPKWGGVCVCVCVCVCACVREGLTIQVVFKCTKVEARVAGAVDMRWLRGVPRVTKVYGY